MQKWHFGWVPEAGLVVPLGRAEIALLTMVRYNWTFSAGGSGDQKYWGFNIGVRWRDGGGHRSLPFTSMSSTKGGEQSLG